MDDFTDVSQLISDDMGIYALFQDDICVYVGRSKHIYKRIKQHRGQGFFEFNKVFVKYCAPEDLSKLEFETIRKLRPTQNKDMTEINVNIKADYDLIQNLIAAMQHK